MIVSHVKVEKEFEPIKVEITFESKSELESLLARVTVDNKIINYHTINKYVCNFVDCYGLSISLKEIYNSLSNNN